MKYFSQERHRRKLFERIWKRVFRSLLFTNVSREKMQEAQTLFFILFNTP